MATSDESAAERDAIANRRVRLRRVVSPRLGMPEQVEILDPAGAVLALITATEQAIEIVAAGGAAVRVESGPTAGGRALRVEFER